VTIVVQGRECVLGEVGPEGVIRLSTVGQWVQAEWLALPARFQRITLDAYVVMPNHVHGMIVIAGAAKNGDDDVSMVGDGGNEDDDEAWIGDGGRGEASASERAVMTNPPAADASPLRSQRSPRSPRAHGTRQGSLGAMIQNFKAVSTRRLNALRGMPGASFWQRNYWEHVVRGPADLDRIRAYIQANPARWAVDQLNPAA